MDFSKTANAMTDAGRMGEDIALCAKAAIKSSVDYCSVSEYSLLTGAVVAVMVERRGHGATVTFDVLQASEEERTSLYTVITATGATIAANGMIVAPWVDDPRNAPTCRVAGFAIHTRR